MKIRLWIKRLIVAIGFGDRLIEFCDVCGVHQPLSWWADESLWWNLVGKHAGCLCPRCFDERATAAGLFLVWRPEVREFDVGYPAESAASQAVPFLGGN